MKKPLIVLLTLLFLVTIVTAVKAQQTSWSSLSPSTFQVGDTILIRRGAGDYYLLDKDDFIEDAAEVMASISNLNATAISSGQIDNTELGYLDGVTSNIQTQLGTKQNLLTDEASLYSSLSDVTQFWEAGDNINTGTIDGEILSDDSVDDDSIDFTDVTLADLTFDVGNVSTLEFGYLDGVTSNIQTQLSGKQDSLSNEASLYSSLSDVTQFWEAGDTIDTGVIDGEIISNDSIDDDSIDFTDVTLADLTFDVGGVTTTEFGYLDGVTSNIQAQIDGLSGGGGGGSYPNLTQNVIYASGHIESPEVKSYYLSLDAVKTGTLTKLVARAGSGACTIVANVNGFSAGANLNVSTTKNFTNYTVANDVMIGDEISLEVVSNTACEDLAFTLIGTETDVE